MVGFSQNLGVFWKYICNCGCSNSDNSGNSKGSQQDPMKILEIVSRKGRDFDDLLCFTFAPILGGK